MKKITVVGLGPGALEQITPAALKAIEEATVVVGYRTYLELIEPLLGDREVISTSMTHEIERVDLAIEAARQGKQVCVVSSGDAGLYGMAGLVLERAGDEAHMVSVVPGISSAFSAAALLGAPLMHDTALISLSDLLTDGQIIRKRLKAAAEADFVVVLYNPKSKKRTALIKEAEEIMLKYRSKDTPVGIVRNGFRNEQQVELTVLEGLGENPLVDMLSTVVIGNSSTLNIGGKMITPRGYERKG